jgi:hypothetical protein
MGAYAFTRGFSLGNRAAAGMARARKLKKFITDEHGIV